MKVFIVKNSIVDDFSSNDPYGVYSSREKAIEAWKVMNPADFVLSDYANSIEIAEFELDAPPKDYTDN